MKNLKLYLIIVCLAIGAGYLGYQLYLKTDHIEQMNDKKAKQANAIQTEATEIARKVDKKGLETVLFEVTNNTVKPNDLTPSNTKGIIDTTALALDIRNKQLKEILVVKASLEAENLKLRRQLDVNNKPFYTYNGEGLNLKFTPPYNDLDTADHGKADFSANVSIKATQYWKRNWVLGSKKSILAVTSDNARFKINGADFVEFEQKQPIFGLRVQAGANYNPQTGSVGFGPALRLDIGRVSLQGNYTWYPESDRWRPSINANYDLIRF